jgi:uncharacterized membrane protein YcjF (UPF0283 family)
VATNAPHDAAHEADAIETPRSPASVVGRRGPRPGLRPTFADLAHDAVDVEQAAPRTDLDEASGASQPEARVAAARPTPTSRGVRHPLRPTYDGLSARTIAGAPPPEPDDRSGADDLIAAPSFLAPIFDVLRIAAVLVGLLGLAFAVAQGVFLFNQIALMPGWLRIPAYALLAALALVTAYFAGRLVWSYARLPASPRLHLDLYDDLKRREAARADVDAHKYAEARRILTRFLREYPLGPAAAQKLRRLGLAAGDVETLFSLQHVLTDQEAVVDDGDWLRRFDREFLGPLDAIADGLAARQARQVFLLTASLPRGSLDTLVVLAATYRLVGDLCTVYNVRAGKWETWMILVSVLMNLVAASQFEGVSDALGQHASGALDHATGVGSAMAAGMAGQVLGKVADGGANWVLFRRLTIRVRQYLRPIRPQQA